jgi:hypothetical protein
VQTRRLEQQAVVEQFLVALQTGQLQKLMDILAPDVVLIADGGGQAAAAASPIHGAELVANLLVHPNRVGTTRTMWLNGATGVQIEVNGVPVAAVSFVVENGRILRIYAIANPGKLTRLNTPTELTR